VLFRPGGDARGKLRGLARWWAGGGGAGVHSSSGRASLIAELREAGLDEAGIAAALANLPAPKAADPAELDEADEGRAAALFLALDTQWHWAAAGMISGFGGGIVSHRTGIRYEAIPVVAGALGIVPDAAVLADLRVMEGEALKVMAEQRARD
jgi:hypothetical protein